MAFFVLLFKVAIVVFFIAHVMGVCIMCRDTNRLVNEKIKFQREYFAKKSKEKINSDNED